jgi:hypothetical protein
MIEKQPEPPQRRQRLLARRFGQAARPVETGAEPGKDLLVEDRRRDPRRSRIDDKANGVRPDVDDPCRFGVFQA